MARSPRTSWTEPRSNLAWARARALHFGRQASLEAWRAAARDYNRRSCAHKGKGAMKMPSPFRRTRVAVPYAIGVPRSAFDLRLMCRNVSVGQCGDATFLFLRRASISVAAVLPVSDHQ